MKLEIEDNTGTLDRKFGLWLLTKIRPLLINSINDKKLSNWDSYIEENFTNLYLKETKAVNIVKEGIQNLICDEAGYKLTIRISPNIYVKGLDRVKLNSICKLINYGNLSKKGYPIFTDTFDIIADNIQVYVEEYLGER